MALNKIIVKGARENNLKNIDIELPKEKLIVFTGLSGSGKSSLAFNTIYAEGERRYIESLSSFSRQFLKSVEKPDVDDIEGLSPAISIDQKTTSHNPRSTVGTTTEIHDRSRIFSAIETSLEYSNGLIKIAYPEKNFDSKMYSTKYNCAICGFSVPSLDTNLFSFNKKTGACETCTGLGVSLEADIDLIVPDKTISINSGAILY
jgi:excinuclease UvrABC ATPase subunit